MEPKIYDDTYIQNYILKPWMLNFHKWVVSNALVLLIRTFVIWKVFGTLIYLKDKNLKNLKTKYKFEKIFHD